MGNDPYIPEIGIRGDGNSSANGNTQIFVSNIGKTGILVLVVCVGLAVGLAVGALTLCVVNGRQADVAEREARMLQYYVLEMDAKLIAAGFKTDTDSVAKKLKEKGK